MKKEHTSASLVGAISGDRVNMNVAIASQPTSELRAELEARVKELEAAGIVPDKVLYLEVPDDMLIERVVGRRRLRGCGWYCGRCCACCAGGSVWGERNVLLCAGENTDSKR